MSHLLSTFSERNRHQARRTLRAYAASATSAVRVELIGDRRAAAPGLEVRSKSPVSALCRVLVAAGHDPAMPLHSYRGDTLALKVHSIGEAARFTVEDNDIGKPVFRRWRDRSKSSGAGSPIAPTAPALRQARPLETKGSEQ